MHINSYHEKNMFIAVKRFKSLLNITFYTKSYDIKFGINSYLQLAE